MEVFDRDDTSDITRPIQECVVSSTIPFHDQDSIDIIERLLASPEISLERLPIV